MDGNRQVFGEEYWHAASLFKVIEFTAQLILSGGDIGIVNKVMSAGEDAADVRWADDFGRSGSRELQPVSRLGTNSRFSGGLFGKVDDKILGLASPEKVGGEAGYSVEINSINLENINSIRRIAANRASGQYNILDARINSRGLINNSGIVKVYRVEGDQNQRFLINLDGNVKLAPNNNTMLFLNFGDSQRAMNFLAQRLRQPSLFNPTLRSFEVDSKLLLKLRLQSVPQRFGRLYPEYAQIADPTKAADQFGLPSAMFEELIPSIRPGSGLNY